MTVSRRLRFEVLRRDAYTCRYCGAKAPDAALTVDHVIPVTLGGDDDPRNLVTACADCNAGKSSIAPDAAIVEDVDATAMLFASAVEEVARRRRADREHIKAVGDRFNQRWTPSEGVIPPRPEYWRDDIERFYGLGLDEDDLAYYLGVAWRSKAGDGNVWRYFCGCCWRELTTRQETARRLLEDGDV